jgi:hypothetical protein
MFDHTHYVPILKGKEGEFRALSLLSERTKPNITPFIDIPRIDLNWTTNLPKDTVEGHLAKKAKKIAGAWGTERPVFVDVFDLSLDLKTTAGTHCIDFLFTELRKLRVKAIPAVGLDRSSNGDYLRAVGRTIRKDSRGVSIRLLSDDMEVPIDGYAAVTDLIATLGLSEEEVHLLMDFRDITEDGLPNVTAMATRFLTSLPTPKFWKTVVLACSAFPENLGGIPTRSVRSLPRSEWDLRNAIVRNKKIPRLPAFGDYGICHPDLQDYDPRFTPTAAIRYTIERGWLIVKAASIKKYKNEQFRELSAMLRRRPEYYGISFSWGDNYISDCADSMTRGPGNLTTWRQVGTNHHIAVVTNQIASFAGA